MAMMMMVMTIKMRWTIANKIMLITVLKMMRKPIKMMGLKNKYGFKP